ncbi:histidinol dehydrogenase [Acidocella aminolytica]|uniref:Histidinol dehydrogenase n=1 Tax=Acidocella aminolytica 101 = DSM 11237 TaxID=1120923 RepID=A0A0D6PHD1_9PROT|nr:histidinol dehydrogenase [Acidocella aminolytica]GAN80781.1 histidinol dehydrogenase [Acidocella aminolytica 101 = DSM 11237]GBQ36462.1 histidinol dehydrogenase [Acidocella aminolytica 101 = DSM 11237]SHE33644.1 histidinol dehydrogenase [Acidocella aminolytica 101 = DSM 11237]
MKTLSTTTPSFEADFTALLARASVAPEVSGVVREIIERVRTEGDVALLDYIARFDKQTLTAESLRVTAEEIEAALAQTPEVLSEALAIAARRIELFHKTQLPRDIEFTDEAGITCGMRWGALDAVGLYVPGGKAAYPSSVLMNAIPAKVAGVGRIAMVVPAPGRVLNPYVLAAAHAAGITEIYRVGGAQAVAALAYGTATIKRVDRIVGPGNAYVAEAKRQVFGQVGIDSIAGPSEVLIIADEGADPTQLAYDLLAQAEHDEDAQSILVTTSASLAEAVANEVTRALETLPRKQIARTSWDRHGAIILVQDEDEAVDIANRVAPEHLQLMLIDPAPIFSKVRHAGAVFLGRNTPEAMGDYIIGPNHVLPTSGTARFASGLSVYDFMKRTTYAAVPGQALAALGPHAVTLAKAEGLTAHAQSIAVRLPKD